MTQRDFSDGDRGVPGVPTEGLPKGFPAPGQILGDRHQIRSLLGRGGMGEVRRALDLELRVEVALKALLPDLFEDERRRDLLRREDVDEAMALLSEIGAEVQTGPQCGAFFLKPLEFLDLNAVDDCAVVIRARIETLPRDQRWVGRELNRPMERSSDERGVEIPFPHTALRLDRDRQGKAPGAFLEPAPDTALDDRGATVGPAQDETAKGGTAVARFFKNRDANRGMAPGSLVFIGDQKVDALRVRVIDYDRENLSEARLEEIRQGTEFKETRTVTWINVDGLHDLEAMRQVGTTFGLHPLVLEDILNTAQRPKVEEFDDYVFICLKMMRYDEASRLVVAEQLSMVIGETFLLTFQEQPGDVFEPVRERIRKQKGRIRAAGIDYLAYALLDTIVDNYIYIIERMGEQIEDMEEGVLSNPSSSIMEKINDMKREMGFLRKSIRPAREAIIKLARMDNELLKADTIPFLKDLEDLITQAAEAIDTYRDMLSDHLNMYNSAVSNRMNDIMKVLTIFAAIFIPLTFIAGIYGTNFDYLPELHFKYSYFVLWGVMISVAVAMLAFFKKKDWL